MQNDASRYMSGYGVRKRLSVILISKLQKIDECKYLVFEMD
jgi:hypothetical protein